jgi:type III restriction enzyme
MTDSFFERPIINSPYERPTRHWALGEDGQPTGEILEQRRRSDLITPVPKPKKRQKTAAQSELELDAATGVSTDEQRYDPTPIINELRMYVDQWRELKNPGDWLVTPESARLLQHWRHHDFQGLRPFFCQIEAVETAIWLTEVAPRLGKQGRKFIEHLDGANEAANPGLLRMAFKLATGAGKTTVMAMIIAWQTINAVRRPDSKKFTRGFLVVTPGLTIRDRLNVLKPNDPYSYYQSRELVPPTCLRICTRPRPSSQTTTLSTCVSGWNCQKAGVHCSKVGRAKRRKPSRPRGRCFSGLCPS